ncbi:MAG TPA: helix-turn-helix transcriptional regulator [Solirubrobacterales bacterium]|nr:helix-turn-helix transcriptional regulator [Solirubrobacterales bacterium]
MTVAKRVGRNIAEARRDAGLSQTQLAVRMEAASQEISRLECGRRSIPNLETLLRVARALEIPVTDLLRGVE